MDNEITPERLERSYLVAAKIVQLYGDKYLAGFLRIKEELNQLQAMAESKQLAMKAADNYEQYLF